MDIKFVKFYDHLTPQFIVYQPLFIFNLNLGVDLRDQLLLKCKLEFDDFGLFGILWLLDFYCYINFKIWISFD